MSSPFYRWEAGTQVIKLTHSHTAWREQSQGSSPRISLRGLCSVSLDSPSDGHGPRQTRACFTGMVTKAQEQNGTTGSGPDYETEAQGLGLEFFIICTFLPGIRIGPSVCVLGWGASGTHGSGGL